MIDKAGSVCGRLLGFVFSSMDESPLVFLGFLAMKSPLKVSLSRAHSLSLFIILLKTMQ